MGQRPGLDPAQFAGVSFNRFDGSAAQGSFGSLQPVSAFLKLHQFLNIRHIAVGHIACTLCFPVRVRICIPCLQSEVARVVIRSECAVPKLQPCNGASSTT